MLNKKLLLNLVIFQGILIVISIIAIIIGIIYKYNNAKNSQNSVISNIDIEKITLFDEEHFQQKIIKNKKIIFQIIKIDTNELKREIIIEQ